MNNFQRLQQEVERENPAPVELRENILDSMRMLDFFGQALNLYLPRVLETFVIWLGGTPDQLEAGDTPDFTRISGAADADHDQAPGHAAGTDDISE